MTTGGYSQDTIRIFTSWSASSGQPARIEGAEESVGPVPPVGQPLRGVAAPGRQGPRDLAGGVRVQVGAIPGVVGGRVLAHHERPVARDREQRFAQDLI